MEKKKTATIGEVQKIIQIRANLECLEKKLTKENALELAKRIRPVMSMDESGKFSISNDPENPKYWVSGCKIYGQSYTFAAGEKVYGKAEKLEPVAKITTYHVAGHPLFLKPSVYEVLYQIPTELVDKTVAFELYAPSSSVYDIYNDEIGRHALTCILYTGEMPEHIKDEPIEW